MSFFGRSAPKAEERGITWPGYPHPPSMFASYNASGVPVTLQTFTRDAAADACVRVLVSTIKKLPVDQVRTVGDTRRPMPSAPVVRRPSARVRQRAFVAQWVRSLATAGNVYGDIVTLRAGTMLPEQIELLDPGRASWDSSSGEWVCRIDGKPRDIWPMGDLFHAPATDFLPPGQPHGLSPVELHSLSIGTSIAAQEFGARFFGDGAHPSSIIYSETALTPEQAQAIKRSFLDAMRGTREPAVFGSGLRHEKVSVDPKDSQFIELLQFEAVQASRRWGVPPSMIFATMAGQNITYQNVSQSDLQFLKHSVDNWLVDIEDPWSEWLPSPQRVKFNTSGLLRMDDPSRWQIHDLRLKNKTTTINAVRALEDEAPFDDPVYDQPGIPGLDLAAQPSGGTDGGTPQ